MGVLRVLEMLFFVYFLTHIPLTVLINSQILFPERWYPSSIREMIKGYSFNYKDPTVIDPPTWYLSFVLCEVFLQFPFFFFATYAFWKGSCSWIRIPAIVYSAHVSTTLLPMLAYFLFHDFPKNPQTPGPSSLAERLTVCGFYLPYLIIPLTLLITMVVHPDYSQEKRSKKVK